MAKITDKGDKKKDAEKKITAQQYVAEAGYAMELINSDPSLQEWIKRVRNYMDKNKGRTPTDWEMDGLKRGIQWFEKYNAEQELARMQQADPRRKADFERSIVLRKEKVRGLAENIGVELDDEFLSAVALDARLNNLTDDELIGRIRPRLERAILAGEDLSGRAAEFERELVQWANKNGLTLSGQTIARYVTAGVEGKQTIDDMKADVRRTYLMGEYPSWSERIAQGEDPADFAEPYREKMAALLEMDKDSISLNDPLLRSGLQGVDANGKPTMVPLYDFEKRIRQDPRWQKTDNAYATYSTVADDILKMFGFR